MARYDRMGLLWFLKGERVVALTATDAVGRVDVLPEGLVSARVTPIAA
jgi:hypothetical protein